MTRDQETILWLGLILVALNVIVHLSDFKAVIFGGPVNAGKGGVNIPGIGNVGGSSGIFPTIGPFTITPLGPIIGGTGLLSSTTPAPQNTPSSVQVM